MNAEVQFRFNQYNIAFQKIINTLREMQQTIDDLQTNKKETEFTNNIVSILATYETRIEELEDKIKSLEQ